MNFIKKSIVFFFFLLVSCSESNLTKNNGVVVTRHHLATDIGAKILKDGGNAFDSSIAVGFALAVVNPSAGNL